MNTLVNRFARNIVGRDFAVGDIHGKFSRLAAALDEIGFDEDVDRLFSVGDLVDRGPESHCALDWIGKTWFHAVRGNHEDMAIRWPDGEMGKGTYVGNGGGWNVANTPDVQRRISDAFKTLPIAIEVATLDGPIGIVHADCPLPDWTDFVSALLDSDMPGPTRASIADAAIWSRKRVQSHDRSGVSKVRAVIVGHTPLACATVLGNVYHIDTASRLRDGCFTFINLATLEMIPATEQILPCR
ncbi:metallophosphoesterase [Paraburkholderia sp. D15]|uniref:metallophosphoesterase n=1 Tax=Paraburkholderia sp. D15 TaxID=2880218 RepID=UPI002479FDFB|nr:metallophosphoesterase [Paraburkholderia sp. D15]WGS52678.1 metallophosphoesterase [Paraburkholderia sp. D15]